MSSSFEDLEVWKKSCRLAVRLYELLKDCRDYGMKDQIFRSSVSIPSNIAEGSERNSILDFQRFINIAKGSAAELRTQVYISREVRIFSDIDAKELIQELKTISKMLQALYNSLNKNRKLKTVNRYQNSSLLPLLGQE
ncbi:MAG: four helix bundle protein [Pseudomonadota bacterium]